MPRAALKRTSSTGERIRQLRIERGLTQTQLGESVGVSQRVITYYEVKGVSPAPELLLKLAEALGVTTDELLGKPKSKRSAAAAPTNLRLWKRLRKIETLRPHDQKAVLRMIDAFAAQAGRRKAS